MDLFFCYSTGALPQNNPNVRPQIALHSSRKKGNDVHALKAKIGKTEQIGVELLAHRAEVVPGKAQGKQSHKEQAQAVGKLQSVFIHVVVSEKIAMRPFYFFFESLYKDRISLIAFFFLPDFICSAA